MTAAKNPKDVILVNCQEVPETICVEMKFITKSGKQHNIDQIFSSNHGNFELNNAVQSTCGKTVQPVPKIPVFAVSNNATLSRAKPNSETNATILQCQLPQQVQPVRPLDNNAFKRLHVEMNNAVLETSSEQSISNVVRCAGDQMQQTDISAFNTKSIAIQCKLDEEIEDLDDEWPVVSNNVCEGNENEMESFLKFIKDNSTQQKNYKECLICGELCKSNKYFYGHMAVHRGPKALCSKCGQYLEHENLLHQHKCKKSKQLAEAFLKCPHFSCDVTAISLLELSDHINEHSNSGFYKCSACRRSFCTCQEFLRHILIRAKCYTTAKRKRFRLYGLESQTDRQCRVRVFTLHTYKKCTILVKTFLTQRAQRKRTCKICFKYLRSKFVYNRHRRMCIAGFKKRLQKKNEKNNLQPV